MISKLRLENFQGFRSKTEIELAPITLIFGPNSSGKSSLIKSILLLKQTLHRPLENGELNFVDREVDLGSFLTVVYGHDSSSDISLGLSLENKRTNTQFDLKISDPGFVNELKISTTRLDSIKTRKDKRTNPTDFLFEPFPAGQVADGFNLKLTRADGDLQSFRISQAGAQDLRNLLNVSLSKQIQSASVKSAMVEALKNATWTMTPDFRLIPGMGFELRMEEIHKKNIEVSGEEALSPYFVHHQVMAKINHPRSAVARLLANTAHIAGLRQIPKRFSAIGNNDGLEADGANIAEVLAANPGSVQLASKWLNKVTNKAYALKYVPISTKVEGIYSNIGALILEDKRTGTETTFQDVGLGLSQVLPILTAFAQFQTQQLPKRDKVPSSDSLLLLEQPELHLHPKMQSDLMEIIIRESMALNANGPQVIMETHSENMILKVQKMIRTGQLSHKDISVLYVDRKSRAKSSTVLRLNLSETGEFVDKWPVGFADLRLSEIFD